MYHTMTAKTLNTLCLDGRVVRRTGECMKFAKTTSGEFCKKVAEAEFFVMDANTTLYHNNCIPNVKHGGGDQAHLKTLGNLLISSGR